LHFDHIKGLPTFIDNLAEQFDEPVTVAATEPVIQGLRDYVFNDSLYPNFFALPSRQNPVLKARILEPGKPTSFGQIEVIPVPVNHTVPTVGYMIKDRKAALLYSGDTHETEEIWSVARTTPLLQAAFIEASFPEECAELAQQTKHLTPSLLASEWQKANKEQVPVYAYHLKPLFRDAIAQQLHALGIPRLSILEEGQTITL
jgi:cAMP phosphodiesterase